MRNKDFTTHGITSMTSKMIPKLTPKEKEKLKKIVKPKTK